MNAPRFVRCRPLLASILPVLFIAPASAGTFESLGPLPVPPLAVYDISAATATLVGVARNDVAGKDQSYRWTQAGGIEWLPEIVVGGHHVSADGTTIAGDGTALNSNDATGIGTRWTESGVQVIGSLPGFDWSTMPLALSANGYRMVGEAWGQEGFQAFVWDELDGIRTLPDLSGRTNESRANAISGDGATAVGQGTLNQSVPVQWKLNTVGGWSNWSVSELGDLPGGDKGGEATAVNFDGSAIYGHVSSTTALYGEAFRWTQAGGMVGLGLLPGDNFSSVGSASDDGSVVLGVSWVLGTLARHVVWDADGNISELPTFFTSHGVTGFDGWSFRSVAMSRDGQTFVGTGTNPDGDWQVWRASLAHVPEPSGLALGIIAVAMAASLVRRLRTAPQQDVADGQETPRRTPTHPG